MIIADSQFRTISVSDDDSDGVFDDLSYGTGFGPDDMSYHDGNMDGQFDLRLGPMPEVWIQSDWRELVRNGSKQFVNIDGERMEVQSVDGVWETVQPDGN